MIFFSFDVRRTWICIKHIFIITTSTVNGHPITQETQLRKTFCKICLQSFSENFFCLEKAVFLQVKSNIFNSPWGTENYVKNSVWSFLSYDTHLYVLGLWDSGIEALADGIALNQSLMILDMRNNQITHEGAAHLADALKRNKTLKGLDLRWNNIGILGGREILSVFKYNKSLTCIELTGN